MKDWLSVVAVYLVPAYLVGSIPWGYLFGRFKGVDIRQHGSGNIGATNAWRVLGRGWGSATFVLDFLKVPFAAAVTGLLGSLILRAPLGDWAHAMIGIAPFLGAVLGHNYSLYLAFRGGKGIATSAGGLLWLMPTAFLTVALSWGLIFGISRYVSLASVVAALVLPVTAFLLYRDQALLWIFSTFLSAMAIWRHRSNLERLMRGTEHRWAPGKEPAVCHETKT